MAEVASRYWAVLLSTTAAAASGGIGIGDSHLSPAGAATLQRNARAAGVPLYTSLDLLRLKHTPPAVLSALQQPRTRGTVASVNAASHGGKASLLSTLAQVIELSEGDASTAHALISASSASSSSAGRTSSSTAAFGNSSSTSSSTSTSFTAASLLPLPRFFLKLQSGDRERSASAYSRDDLWVVSTTLSFGCAGETVPVQAAGGHSTSSSSTDPKLKLDPSNGGSSSSSTASLPSVYPPRPFSASSAKPTNFTSSRRGKGRAAAASADGGPKRDFFAVQTSSREFTFIARARYNGVSARDMLELVPLAPLLACRAPSSLSLGRTGGNGASASAAAPTPIEAPLDSSFIGSGVGGFPDALLSAGQPHCVRVCALRVPVSLSAEVAMLQTLGALHAAVVSTNTAASAAASTATAAAAAAITARAVSLFPLSCTLLRVSVPSASAASPSFGTATSYHTDVFRLLLSRSTVAELSNAFISRYRLNTDQIAVVHAAVDWFQCSDDEASRPLSSSIVLCHGVFGSGKSHLLVGLIHLLSTILDADEEERTHAVTTILDADDEEKNEEEEERALLRPPTTILLSDRSDDSDDDDDDVDSDDVGAVRGDNGSTAPASTAARDMTGAAPAGNDSDDEVELGDDSSSGSSESGGVDATIMLSDDTNTDSDDSGYVVGVRDCDRGLNPGDDIDDKADDNPTSTSVRLPPVSAEAVRPTAESSAATTTIRAAVVPVAPLVSSRRRPNDRLRILVCSNTNVAVDRVLCGLLSEGFTDLARVGSLRRMDAALLPYAIPSTTGSGPSQHAEKKKAAPAGGEAGRPSKKRLKQQGAAAAAAGQRTAQRQHHPKRSQRTDVAAAAAAAGVEHDSGSNCSDDDADVDEVLTSGIQSHIAELRSMLSGDGADSSYRARGGGNNTSSSGMRLTTAAVALSVLTGTTSAADSTPTDPSGTVAVPPSTKAATLYLRQLRRARVYGTTVAATALPGLIHRGAFPIVVLDEASQMSEVSSLAPLVRFGAARLLAVGDPAQLAPVHISSPCGQQGQLQQQHQQRCGQYEQQQLGQQQSYPGRSPSRALDTLTLDSCTLFERLAIGIVGSSSSSSSGSSINSGSFSGLVDDDGGGIIPLPHSAARGNYHHQQQQQPPPDAIYIRLHTQYRCAPLLSRLASVLFYGGTLLDGASVLSNRRGPIIRLLPPLVFFDYSNLFPPSVTAASSPPPSGAGAAVSSSSSFSANTMPANIMPAGAVPASGGGGGGGVTGCMMGPAVQHDPSTMLQQRYGGSGSGEGGSGSLSNEHEVRIVASLVLSMLRRGVKPSAIGVICMYRAQASRVSALLGNYKSGGSDPSIGAAAATVMVSTVDAFQGSERNIIVLSCSVTSRSQARGGTSTASGSMQQQQQQPSSAHNNRGSISHNSGSTFGGSNIGSSSGVSFCDEPRRLNVCLTRARHHLCIVGHARALSGGGDVNNSSCNTGNPWLAILAAAVGQPGGVRSTALPGDLLQAPLLYL